MIKIKTNNPKLTRRLTEELQIPQTDDYKYILTNTSKCEEDGKITIIFKESNIEEIKKLINIIILNEPIYLTIENSLGKKRVDANSIDYFEALENSVFAVIGKNRYYVSEKLYVLEKMLSKKNFIRTSKSFLVNILKIDYVRPMLNYRLELVMTNGEKIDVNRTYVKEFKKSLKV